MTDIRVEKWPELPDEPNEDKYSWDGCSCSLEDPDSVCEVFHNDDTGCCLWCGHLLNCHPKHPELLS